jgi:hypothetical protein
LITGVLFIPLWLSQLQILLMSCASWSPLPYLGLQLIF